MCSLSPMRRSSMTTQDGISWVTEKFNAAKSDAAKGTRRTKPPYTIKTDVAIDLVFSRYGSERTTFAGTGRVSGSRRVELEDKETLTVPAGTEVSLYCLPQNAAHAASVATFFLEGELVTYKREVDLFHRKPATPKPRSVPAATPLLRLT